MGMSLHSICMHDMLVLFLLDVLLYVWVAFCYQRLEQPAS